MKTKSSPRPCRLRSELSTCGSSCAAAEQGSLSGLGAVNKRRCGWAGKTQRSRAGCELQRLALQRRMAAAASAEAQAARLAKLEAVDVEAHERGGLNIRRPARPFVFEPHPHGDFPVAKLIIEEVLVVRIGRDCAVF